MKRMRLNNMKNRFNRISNSPNTLTLEINKNLRVSQPTLRTIGKWREEWVAKGFDKRMTFQDYKRGKCKRWHREKNK